MILLKKLILNDFTIKMHCKHDFNKGIHCEGFFLFFFFAIRTALFNFYAIFSETVATREKLENVRL